MSVTLDGAHPSCRLLSWLQLSDDEGPCIAKLLDVFRLQCCGALMGPLSCCTGRAVRQICCQCSAVGEPGFSSAVHAPSGVRQQQNKGVVHVRCTTYSVTSHFLLLVFYCPMLLCIRHVHVARLMLLLLEQGQRHY